MVWDGEKKSERALLFGIHDEAGNHNRDHDQLLPTLFGTDVGDANYRLRGLGPVSMKSPNCADGDLRHRDPWLSLDPHIEAIYAAEVGNPDGNRQVQTDENGGWEFDITVGLDGTFSMGQICYNGDCCLDSFSGHIGRHILAEDREEIPSAQTWQIACPLDHEADGIPPAELTQITSTDHDPKLAFHPDSVFSTSQDLFDTLPFRFRITDTGQDVDIDQVTVKNTQSGEVFKAYYMADQSDHSPAETAGDWGWFVAEVPFGLGQTTLQIQASDEAVPPNTLDETVTVTRVQPLVWAEDDIFPPHPPQQVEPTQFITIDASDSVAPGLGEPGGAVAKWVFFRYKFTTGAGISDPVLLGESPYLSGAADLVLDYNVPRHTYLYNDRHRIRGRLVIAKDQLRFNDILNLREFEMRKRARFTHLHIRRVVYRECVNV